MERSEIIASCLSNANESYWIQQLVVIRWPSGFLCPSCGSPDAFAISTRRLPLYECNSCGRQTSLTSGTIMERSRTPVRLWMLAIYLHSFPEGICALHLANLIGTTYKTAWLICHKIRHAMAHAEQNELLKGIVRINFAQYGRPYNPTIYRHPQEQPLLIGASMDGQGEFTHIKIKQAIEECSFPQFTCPLNKHPFIRKHVDPRAIEVIAVTKKYSKDRNIQLIGMSQTASRWINSVFKGIGAKHLQVYLDQYCYGYNITRKITAQTSDAFSHLIRLCTTTSAMTYPQLISKPNLQPQLRMQYAHYLRNAS
ncbi:transposase [Cohnella cholangitidis]|uniref:Transposase n=1 Tax=Cohnella cholangitidis TaxID=2598458 RepID=A0A7G5BT31_9BACL|nr:transposase [Cohnella cholangitidis]QMV40115.1 transposase [Cohnella cholangitidis]